MSGRTRPPAGAIGWREQRPADEAIVRRAHLEHRRALFAGLPWPADALARLCEQQHVLQEAHIAAHHPAAERRMILLRGRAVGRLCLDRGDGGGGGARAGVPWRIIDLALVPEAQGAGIGTAALDRLIDEAARAGAGLELQVGRDNPRAEALYRRLGFETAIGDSDTHRRMVRGARPTLS